MARQMARSARQGLDDIEASKTTAGPFGNDRQESED